MHPGVLRPWLPLVWGLPLFPCSDGMHELALAQRVSAAPAAARARTVRWPSPDAVREPLESAGASDVWAALRTAGLLEGNSRRSPAESSVFTVGDRSAQYGVGKEPTRPDRRLARFHTLAVVC